jgi:hypothetical protein
VVLSVLVLLAGFGAIGAAIVHALALLDIAPASLQLPAILLFLTIFPALVGTIAVLRNLRESGAESLAFSALFERTPLAVRVGLAALGLYAFGTFIHLVVVDAPGPQGWFGSAEVGLEAQRTFARVTSALTLAFDTLCLTALVGAWRARADRNSSIDGARTPEESMLDELEPLRPSKPVDATARRADDAHDDPARRG